MQSGNKQFDLVVVGGGPAGTATALALRQHAPELSVAIVEASDYSQIRIGETLPPQVQPLLHKLGVWESFVSQGHTEALGTSSTWETDDVVDHPFFFSAYNRGWHLDRRGFDRMLADAARERGVSVFTDTKLVDHEPGDGETGMRLVMQGNADRFEMQAGFVADATGRRATFATREGAERILFDRLVSAIQFFEFEAEHSVDSFTHVEPWENGWWYSALIPDERMVVACMTDADLCQRLTLNEEQRWMEFVQQTEETRRRIEGARPCRSLAVRPASSHRLDRFAGDRWLAVGDAATAYDPLSGQGILKALRFGIFAAYAIGDHLSGRGGALQKYEDWVAADFEGYLEKHAEYDRLEQRWREAEFWSRRHKLIRLDPNEHLRQVPPYDRGRQELPGEYLSRSEYEQLYALCRPGRHAASVLTEFKKHSEELSDQRIILGLQHLVEEGMLEIVAG